MGAMDCPAGGTWPIRKFGFVCRNTCTFGPADNYAAYVIKQTDKPLLKQN